ncbi:MAG: right-handed parallel beta-helix repeat-containing protein, partial [Phycisphaerae bacterium]|nr:right-handed parallel beta-helix repeat-containing protein [Phycisphaerae bacterium]
DGRDAILWYSTGVVVRNNRSYRCRYGFHLMFSDSVTIEDNDLTENSVGVYLMYSSGLTIKRNRMVNNRGPSGYGLGLKEADKYNVIDNVFVGNRAGVYIDGSPFTKIQPGEFTRNTFAYNDVGVVMLPAVRGNRLHANNFVDNLVQVGVLGRGNLDGNEFSVNDSGNYWSDYVGYDEDRDGLGDYDYASDHLFENLLDREPKLRIFLLSPAQQAVEFVARALPAMRPEAKFFDPAPLVAPVVLQAGREPGGTSRSGLGMGAAALLLIGGAGALLVASNSPMGLARTRKPA